MFSITTLSTLFPSVSIQYTDLPLMDGDTLKHQSLGLAVPELIAFTIVNVGSSIISFAGTGTFIAPMFPKSPLTFSKVLLCEEPLQSPAS